MKDSNTRKESGWKAGLALVHRFLRPYYAIVIFLGLMNMIPGVLLGLRPLLLSPALGQILPSNVKPAANVWDVTLDNVGPTMQRWLSDGGGIKNIFLWVAVLYLIVTVVSAVVAAFVNTAALKVRLRIFKNMVTALHGHLINLDLAFFVRQKSGELVSRFSMDTAKTAASLDTAIMKMVQSSTQGVICGYLLFRTDMFLAGFILMIGGLHFLTTQLLGGWVKRRTALAYNGQAELSAALQESFQSVAVIKSFVAEVQEKLRINKAAEHLRSAFFRYMVTRYVEEPIRLLTDGLAAATILILCGNALHEGRMTMAGMALFFYTASQMVAPMSDFAKELLALYSVRGGLDRVVELFHTKSDIKDGPLEAKHFSHVIRFESVGFSYPGRGAVLENVSLEIKQGETVAIVGPSGGGKSTLTHLLLRLYDPEQGRISIDGKDVREFTQRSFRSLFGVVSQDCFLFNMSIRDNILLSRPFDEEVLMHSCRIANILDFIRELPKGFDTVVGDRGIRLSGGQRQRLAIARAIYGKPDILILDEATSALDTESERLVQDAIEQALSGLTGVVIAHRLSTIVRATKIVVLDKGGVEAVGTHHELLQKSGTYKRLYMLQFSMHKALSVEQLCLEQDSADNVDGIRS
jgi:subfamily B ATP-binding cassette protein MsbA